MCVCMCVAIHIVRVGESVYGVCVVLEEEVVVYLL